MRKTFTARTPNGLLLASLLQMSGAIKLDEFLISENLHFVLKIDDEGWHDSTIIDYKSARIVESLQKDILGIYNAITGQHIALKDVHKHEQLLVKVELNDGCLEYVWKGMHDVFAYASQFSPENKMLVLKYIFGIIGFSITAWLSGRAIDSYTKIKCQAISSDTEKNCASIKAEAETKCKELETEAQVRCKEIDYMIKKIEAEANIDTAEIARTQNILKKNHRTPKNVSEFISDNATVTLGNTAPISGSELRLVVADKKKEISHDRFHIDGLYKVTDYSFEKCLARLYRSTYINASMTDLNPKDKQTICKLASEYMHAGTSPRLNLQINLDIINGEKHATIIGIGEPRTDSVPLSSLKNFKFASEPFSEQANLLDYTAN
ncbi:hypothetical protein ACI3L3_11840 [Desulfobaculum sp. SPO524]|uniref:hypothetical protein n=1 Tax=Desulfobaculum sp. SPO524 TaxID=3378071 RepID=UPI0038548040